MPLFCRAKAKQQVPGEMRPNPASVRAIPVRAQHSRARPQRSPASASLTGNTYYQRRRTASALDMALQEVTASFLRRLRTQQPSTTLSQASRLRCVRHASSSSPSNQSTAVAQEIQDLEQTDFVKQDPATTEPIKYDPLHRSRSFQGTPPSSRYKFRPPKYYRGPL